MRPPEEKTIVREFLLSPTRSTLQDTLVDAAQTLVLRFNTRGPWNTALANQLMPQELGWDTFHGTTDRECPLYRETVLDTSATAAKVCFHMWGKRTVPRLTPQITNMHSTPPCGLSDLSFSAILTWRPPTFCEPSLFRANAREAPPPPLDGMHLRSSLEATMY